MTSSRTVAGVGYFGPVPVTVWEVLEQAWEHPFSVASNLAREQAVAVSFAASMGWLSTISPTGATFTRLWHITPEGEITLRHKETAWPGPCSSSSSP